MNAKLPSRVASIREGSTIKIASAEVSIIDESICVVVGPHGRIELMKGLKLKVNSKWNVSDAKWV